MRNVNIGAVQHIEVAAQAAMNINRLYVVRASAFQSIASKTTLSPCPRPDCREKYLHRADRANRPPHRERAALRLPAIAHAGIFPCLPEKRSPQSSTVSARSGSRPSKSSARQCLVRFAAQCVRYGLICRREFRFFGKAPASRSALAHLCGAVFRPTTVSNRTEVVRGDCRGIAAAGHGTEEDNFADLLPVCQS